jgi:23S rRNA (cytidine1920-2'-O)/16S rRNA (cytidine1409-2'-O)-methyltransferase
VTGKGGVVRDAAAAQAAAEAITAWIESEAGWRVAGLLPSPMGGGDGNPEFLLGARNG